ncbi:MAG: ATP synthase F1 subunit gamma [Eubacterium sp.]|nr:ATP synthase F1 subunit gamma [Eubacterium sp.]
MASAKEIKNRISSIEDTRKITSAMYMISSTKLRRAKERLEKAEPFFYALKPAIARVLRHMRPGTLNNVYMDDYEPAPGEVRRKRRAYLVVTADKGLAGAYNHNVLKLAESEMAKEGETYLYVVGEVGRQYFETKGIPIDVHFHYTAQDPSLGRARRITSILIDMYKEGEFDEVNMIFTYMDGNKPAEAVMEKLLPLHKAEFLPLGNVDYIYQEEFFMHPSQEDVIDNLVPNYMVGFIYCALTMSYMCEQNSRMTAMKAATDSADDMLKELNKTYNHIRQATITQEITEVIGGAKALKNKK